MKKRFAVFGLLACAIVAVTVYGQDNGDPAKTTPASQPTSPSIGLKDAYAGKFLIGCSAEARGYSEAELANIKANYNVITPENSMKPQPTHPSEDTYNFNPPDGLVKWCLHRRHASNSIHQFRRRCESNDSAMNKVDGVTYCRSDHFKRMSG